MDAQFWINAWNEGRTNFHQAKINEKLIKYFPLLNPKKGEKVLVPLCGKTKDLLWLAGLGLEVRGVELYEEPVKSFFQENNLPAPEISKDQNFTHYSYQNLSIRSGDFFKISPDEQYGLVYDRASIVALPMEMRKRYADLLKRVVKKDGKYLLLAFEYDQSKLEGPPFSVQEKEIRELYGDAFSIEVLETENLIAEGKFSVLDNFKERVYFLKKI